LGEEKPEYHRTTDETRTEFRIEKVKYLFSKSNFMRDEGLAPGSGRVIQGSEDGNSLKY
jgi:hypothetical protein